LRKKPFESCFEPAAAAALESVDAAAGGSGRVLLGSFEKLRKDGMRRNRNRNRNRNNNAMKQAQMAEQAAKAAAAAAASVGCSSASSAAASASSAGAQGITSNLKSARTLQYVVCSAQKLQ
jgi:hypothetical protein